MVASSFSIEAKTLDKPGGNDHLRGFRLRRMILNSSGSLPCSKDLANLRLHSQLQMTITDPAGFFPKFENDRNVW